MKLGIGSSAVVVVALTVAALACSAAPIAPGEQKAIDQLPRIDLLDNTATCYCYRMGWDELKARLAGTTTLAVVEEPGLKTFFKEVHRAGERGDKIGPAFTFLVDACMQELVLAGKPVPADADMDQKVHSIDWLTVRPSDAFRAEFDLKRQAAMKAVEAAGMLPKVKTGEAEKITVSTTAFVANGEDERQLVSAWDGKVLYLAGSLPAAKWLGGMKPMGEKSLARSPQFQATVVPLVAGQPGEPVALYYHDLRPLWKRHEAAAWDKLSWRSVESAGGASFIEGKGFRNRHYWKLAEKRTGLFNFTKGGQANQEWLKRVPADAGAFLTGYWDARSLFMTGAWLGGSLFMGEGGEDVVENADEPLKMLDPLFDSIGPRFMYYRVPNKYGAFPVADLLPISDMVVVLELKDGDAFGKQLDMLLKMSGDDGPFRLEEMHHKGHLIKRLNMMYLSAYMVVQKDTLLVAFHPQLIKDALDNWDKPGPSILDTAAYKAASARLVKDPCFIFYMAPGDFIHAIYDKYIPVVQQAASFLSYGLFDSGERHGKVPERMRGFDVLTLPRGNEFTKHITEGTILSAHDDGVGVLFDGYAPLLTTPYYWVGLQAMIKPFAYPRSYLLELLMYPAKPATKDDAADAESAGADVTHLPADAGPLRVGPPGLVTETRTEHRRVIQKTVVVPPTTAKDPGPDF